MFRIRVTKNPELFIHELPSGEWEVTTIAGKSLGRTCFRESATALALSKSRTHLYVKQDVYDRQIDRLTSFNRLGREMK
jgi:hypothetical protein